MGQFYDEEKIKAMENSTASPTDATSAPTPGTQPRAGKFYDEAKVTAMEAGSTPIAARTQNLVKFALVALLVIAGSGMIWWKIAHNPATMIVDINKASVEQLSYLPGIGEAKAKDIIKHRPYASIEDLKKVSGIGEKTFEKMKPRVKVE